MPTFEIERTFRASRQQVFEAWTKAAHLANWWGPKGFRLNIAKLNLQPSGIFHYSMKTEDEVYEMWGRFIFSEIQEPNRISFVNSFSDDKGEITRAPFSDTWPLEIENVITLSEGNGQTSLILQATPLNAPKIDMKTFEENFESMTHGFTGTFDRLEEYLEESAK